MTGRKQAATPREQRQQKNEAYIEQLRRYYDSSRRWRGSASRNQALSAIHTTRGKVEYDILNSSERNRLAKLDSDMKQIDHLENKVLQKQHKGSNRRSRSSASTHRSRDDNSSQSRDAKSASGQIKENNSRDVTDDHGGEPRASRDEN